MKNKSIKQQVKEMEDAGRAQQEQPAASSDEVVDFDFWWMTAIKKKSLRPHLKEILLADFSARGLSKKETLAKFDEHLAMFGL